MYLCIAVDKPADFAFHIMDILLQTTLCVTSTICLWSAFLLAFNWQGVRQRRWLSAMVFLWGLAWGLRAYNLIFRDAIPTYGIVLPPELILAGIFTSFSFLVWPLSVVSGPKVGARQISLFLLPFVSCTAIYYGTIGLFHLDRFTFSSMSDFWSHISYFSVWFRIVMCLCLICYLIVTINLVIHNINKYNKYVEDNYSEYDKYTINWMPVYLIGLVIIALIFFANLCFASILTFLCHNIIACIFWAWLSAKVMVYNSPFVSTHIEYVIPELSLSKGEDFNSMFDTYKQRIEKWIEDDRPYLNAEFSLKDVMTRFNLNRTYASKIFNDGFGKSFIILVREHRVEYAKKLIENNPSITMSEVAFLCGYSTPQAFHKAFVFCNDGLTPGKFAISKAGKA